MASSLTFTIPVFFTLKSPYGIGDRPKWKTDFKAYSYFGCECIIFDTRSLTFGGDGALEVKVYMTRIFIDGSWSYFCLDYHGAIFFERQR